MHLTLRAILLLAATALASSAAALAAPPVKVASLAPPSVGETPDLSGPGRSAVDRRRDPSAGLGIAVTAAAG